MRPRAPAGRLCCAAAPSPPLARDARAFLPLSPYPTPCVPQLTVCAAVVSVSAAEKKKPYYLPPASASMNAAFSTPYGTSGVSQGTSPPVEPPEQGSLVW